MKVHFYKKNKAEIELKRKKFIEDGGEIDDFQVESDALEEKGWSVWWDPKLRAGEHFDDVIEQALKDAKCVIVMWSKLSVNSRYVKDEANYALKRKKLIPIAIAMQIQPTSFFFCD